MALPPPGRTPARAPGLFCLQPGIANSLIPLLPAYPLERSCCRGSRESIALPGGVFYPDKRAGEFLTAFREAEKGAAPLLLGEVSRVHRSLPGTRAELTPRLPQPRGGKKDAPSDFWTKTGAQFEGCTELWQTTIRLKKKKTTTKPTQNPPHTEQHPNEHSAGIKQEGKTLQEIARFGGNSTPKDYAPSSSPQQGHPIEAKKRQRATPTLIPGTTTFIKNYYYVHRKRKRNQVLLDVCVPVR